MSEPCPSCGSQHEPKCCIHCRVNVSTNGTKSCDNCRKRKTTVGQQANDRKRFKNYRRQHIVKNPKTGKPETMYTVEEVADAMGLCIATVYRYVRSGKLESVRLGTGPHAPWRIGQRALNDFVSQGLTPEKLMSNLLKGSAL